MAILFRAHGQVQKGPLAGSANVYGCAMLSRPVSSDEVSLADVSCPDWVANYAGTDGDLVSIASIAQRGDINVNTDPLPSESATQ